MESYNYERNITEIKKEYEKILIDTLYPSIYRGLCSTYNKSKKDFIEIQTKAKKDPGVQLLKLITVFTQYLKNIEYLPKINIENETNKIKATCKRADYLDELIMACLKSHIVLLSYSYSNKKCKLIKERLHKNIDTVTFIHRCYIECSNIFINHAELFYDDDISKESGITLTDIDKIINKRYIYELIHTGIKNAIRNSIPLKRILDEYLNNDFPEENDNTYNKDNYGEMIKKSLGHSFYDGDIINEDDDKEDNEEFKEDIDGNNDDANELIFNRKKDADTSAAIMSDKEKINDDIIIKKEDSSNKIIINDSSDVKEIDIEFSKTRKKDTTLQNAINEYKKRKESANPDIDIVRA